MEKKLSLEISMKKGLFFLFVFCSQLVFAQTLINHRYLVRKNPTNCDLNVGMADSYVLAVSLEPGFCKTYGYEAGKPECLHLSKASYESNHFSLHGLWPNETACGIEYGFCAATPKAHHCDYAPLHLSNATSTELKKHMPSYRYGSCLERHEWNKHGSCQILTHDHYFSLAMRLAQEVNQSELGQYVTEHYGQKVSLKALREQAGIAFGYTNLGKIHFSCSKGILVDLYISLPVLIPATESLQSLINKATNYPNRDRCPLNVVISNFTSP